MPLTKGAPLRTYFVLAKIGARVEFLDASEEPRHRFVCRGLFKPKSRDKTLSTVPPHPRPASLRSELALSAAKGQALSRKGARGEFDRRSPRHTNRAPSVSLLN